ncbi:hypothetical protein DRH27_05535 [Candidatus Falkowbacteria bacterium]|nr:MAG: hypothetical protein DRH27_05535 [Candidatus Falkowbacteria bacterium]
MASNSTSSADSDIDLSANINSLLSEYYDGSNKTYWRVYQEAGVETLKNDYFNINFTSPVPQTAQIHYLWREDNNNEANAAWLEDEDTGSPTASTSLEKGENIRLRIEAVNTGGGDASNYIYRLEYASTTGNCSTDPGSWTAVPIDNSEHWRMSTSTYINNGEITTFQLDNSEGYNFEDGFMVSDPSSTSSPITLNENNYTEVEYVIKATASANSAGTYCFRTTNDGAALDSYDIFPVITLSGVSNTAPVFTDTGYPSDNDSASTWPTDYGSLVDFTATAVDGENDNYYLAICKTSGIASGNDGPPECSGGEWCISDLASSTEEASCSYSAATSSELLAWYGYVCDKYPGFAVAKCSAYSQGSSTPEDHSPFAVNHQPVLAGVSTTDDNKDPGEKFTITTVSYDNDSAGGADTLDLYVCTENSANSGGCAGATNQTVCFASATSSPNAKCYYQDTAPTPTGSTTYYAFIFDNHDFEASGNSQSSTYTINNVPTVLGDLLLNNGAIITLNFGPSTTTVQTVNSSVEDQNGCTDLVGATARVYMSNVSGGYNCTADDNVCYHVDTGGCVLSDCDGDSDETAIYTCTADLKYYAVPTDGSSGNPYESYNWLSYIQTYDGLTYVSTTSPGVQIETTLALEVTESIINFGSEMIAKENSGTNNSTTTVVNIGNSPINVGLSGTNMTGAPTGNIPVGQIKWSLAENFNYSSTGKALSIGGEEVDIAAPRPASDAGVEDKVYWGIGIPDIADASTYTGVNSFSVILDNNNWPQ